MRQLAVAFALVFGGCVCFQPVDEFPDAGQPDAGRLDAGSPDAGSPDAGTACTTASDCRGTPVVTSWCQQWLGGEDAGFSCVDRRCVAACSATAGQTCVQDPGVECLRCPPAQSCVPPSCGAGLDFDLLVADIACVGAAPFAEGTRVRMERLDGGCGSAMFLETDAGPVSLGVLFAQSARGLSARSELLGGTCLAAEMPTGAYRVLLDCPRCQVALGP
jgi:hypothetical protein